MGEAQPLCTTRLMHVHPPQRLMSNPLPLDATLQLEGYEYPPAIVDAYKSTATAVGAEDISPVYVGAGVVAASGVLLLACRSCQAAPKKKKGRGSKKSKAKAKPSANGSAHKNGGSRKGGAAPAGVAAVNGGSGTRGLPSSQPKPPTSGANAAAPKPAKKAPVKAPQPQGKGRGKGKPGVPEAPPVITVRNAIPVCSLRPGRVVRGLPRLFGVTMLLEFYGSGRSKIALGTNAKYVCG